MNAPATHDPPEENWLQASLDLLGMVGLVAVFAIGFWITPLWIIIPAYVFLFTLGLICAVTFRPGEKTPDAMFPRKPEGPSKP